MAPTVKKKAEQSGYANQIPVSAEVWVQLDSAGVCTYKFGIVVTLNSKRRQQVCCLVW